ncbi:MAG: hypothetical protein SPH68_01130 [Candidatus Borkfalkiaceae bacterium]|nr:hypothetical protein [Clostridia bacterium]MDY6222747.1 hypothetical protein [Christensenellaceae bacterium]
MNYFSDDEREFVIKNMYPVRPLVNYLWNETAFAELNHFGFGYSKACINKRFRNIVNNVRLVYVKDLESGEFFDINRNLRDLPYDVFFSRVGLGYQTIESSYRGIYGTFTVLIPETENVELHKITVKNVSDKPRRLSVYPYVRPAVNLNGHLAYGKGDYDEKIGGLYYTFHAFNENNPYQESFYKCSEKASAYATDDRKFIGVYGRLDMPVALRKGMPESCGTAFSDCYCAAMQIDLGLQAGEEKVIYSAVGIGRNREECQALAKKYTEEITFTCEYKKQRTSNETYIEKFKTTTPDKYLNSVTNIWLKRQVTLGKTWGRIYGKGFRDVLQDITGFVSFDGARAKDRILYTLQHQFISGNGLRMFDPTLDYPYQDMPVWIPMALLAYLKETNDFSVLKERIGYYDDERKESVFLHLKRGMDYLYAHQGEHGLGLWGGGDWNDSMNNCGMLGKGESVWLSIATVKATDDYAEILTHYRGETGIETIVEDALNKKKQLIDNIVTYGFEKDHFIYGINDWGEKIGSYECEEGKTYLNPQTWAVIAGILDNTQSNKLMEHVENNLKCAYGYVQNVPPYTRPDEHIGRMSYFGVGLYENGSVYNHGVMFKIVADCMLKRGDRAYETLKMIRYDNPENPDSGTEPYAVSNMYFGPGAFTNKGHAPYSWTTGSAAWMYRAITEFMLGIRADFDGLIIDPALPSAWNGVTAERVFRGVKYFVSFFRGENKGVYVDGKKIEGNKVPLFEKGSTHTVKTVF